MSENYEPLSPIAVEAKLRGLVNMLTKTQLDLAEARDQEVDAEIAYKDAHRAAMLSPKAPQVARGGPTVADRDAWVDEQCAVVWAAYRRAQTNRAKAEDLLRITRDQGVLVASLSKSVDSAYRMAGRGES